MTPEIDLELKNESYAFSRWLSIILDPAAATEDKFLAATHLKKLFEGKLIAEKAQEVCHNNHNGPKTNGNGRTLEEKATQVLFAGR